MKNSGNVTHVCFQVRHLQMYLHNERACICSNLCGTKKTFVEPQKMHMPPTKAMGAVKSWFIVALRSISLALSSPTLISITTITRALVTVSNPHRLGKKDTRATPLQFQMAIRMSLGAIISHTQWDANPPVGCHHANRVFDSISLFHRGGDNVQLPPISAFWEDMHVRVIAPPIEFVRPYGRRNCK